MSTFNNVDVSTTRAAVVIPCYNAGSLAINAIDSVIEQGYKNKIVCVVDDCSTDNSMDILLSHVDKITQEYINDELKCDIHVGFLRDTKIIIAKNSSNKNKGATKNTGIKLCWNDADVFFPLDADDKYLPGKLEKSIKIYESDKKYIGLIYSDVIICNSGTRKYEFRHPYDREILERENMISNSPLLTKLALGFTGLYDENLNTCEDWDLWLRITENFTAVHIAEPLQEYHITGKNCTIVTPIESINEDRKIVIEKMINRKKARYGIS